MIQPMRTMSSRSSGTGILTSRDWARGRFQSEGSAEAGRVVSDLLDDMLAQQAGWLDQKDDDEDDEGDAVAVLAAAGEIGDDEDFDEAEDHGADDSAGDVADAAEDGGDEGFDAGDESQERFDLG